MKIENIRFKAKRLDNKEWVIGDLLHSYENGAIIVPIEGDGAFSVDPSTICQFTGQKDCKDNEVWEGDILQDVDYDYIKYVVIFGEGTFLARKEGHYTGIPLHECIGDSGNVTYAKVVGDKFDKEK